MEFITTAVWSPNKGHLKYFGITKDTAKDIYSRHPEEVLQVKCTVIENLTYETRDKTKDREYQYVGWLTLKDNTISMIYDCVIKFELCFPNSVTVSEASGYGKSVFLNVEIIDNDASTSA